jgi:signal transduction histidine kinase
MRARPLVGDSIFAAVVTALGLVGQTSLGDAPTAHTPVSLAFVVLCGLLLVGRRTVPMLVWASTAVVGAMGVALSGGSADTLMPALIGVYTMATVRTWRTAVLCAAGTAGLFLVASRVSSDAAIPADATYTLLAVSFLSAAVGTAVRSRRQVFAAAEERAVRAEQTREEEAQRRVTEERLRIARELHDVVAHHIAVINVQSGVAKHLVHSDPAAAEVALGHVRDSSAVVLEEMSTLLGLLRTSDDGPDTQPAPGLAQADALVESVRRSGLTVSWRVTGSPRSLAPSVDLTAYRLVQEALTNAGKHGLGSADVSVDFRDDLVVLDVSNPTDSFAEPTSSGHGLVGMRERVTSVGGTLDAGPRGDGRFHVHAELPLGSADVASAYQRSLA